MNHTSAGVARIAMKGNAITCFAKNRYGTKTARSWAGSRTADATRVLELCVLNARHLPKMDTFGTCDAFVIIQFGDSRFETSVKKGTYSPEWNELFLCRSDSAVGPLIIELYDWNRATRNEKVIPPV